MMDNDEVECLLANMIYKVRTARYFYLFGVEGDEAAFLGSPLSDFRHR